jgi:hypothetical protein
LIKGPDPIPAEIAAKLATADANSQIYNAVKTWATDWKVIKNNPNSPQAKLFLKFMQKIEPYKGETLHRGLKFKTADKRQAFIDKINQERGFVNNEVGMSTSKNETTGDSFSRRDFGLTMEITKHESGRDFEPISHEIGTFTNQQEVLFFSGTKFKLLEITEKNGKPHLILEEAK